MSTALWSAGAAGGKATKKSLALVNIDLQGNNTKLVSKTYEKLAEGTEKLSMSLHLSPAEEHPNT